MNNKKNITGWIGVVFTVIIAGFWAYWGANENFHEGWYSVSIWENLFMRVCQEDCVKSLNHEIKYFQSEILSSK